MNILFGGLQNLWTCVLEWCRITASLNLSLSVGLLILAVFGMILWLFSGVLAADIAEFRGVSPGKHIIGAMLFPFLYPLMLKLMLKPVSGSRESVQLREKEEIKQKKAEAAQAKAEADAKLASEIMDTSHWSMARMERAAHRPDGSEAGPFQCTLGDGRSFRVLRIQNIMNEVVVFELEGATPEAEHPILRFPYEKIVAFVEE